MMTLAEAARYVQDRMETHGGVDVVYRRRAHATCVPFEATVRAVPGRNPVQITDVNGVIIRGQVQDFIIDIETLKAVMSEPAKPLRNDEIVMTVGNDNIVFAVNGEDFANSHFEPADSYGVAWRIHTKSDRIDAP